MADGDVNVFQLSGRPAAPASIWPQFMEDKLTVMTTTLNDIMSNQVALNEKIEKLVAVSHSQTAINKSLSDQNKALTAQVADLQAQIAAQQPDGDTADKIVASMTTEMTNIDGALTAANPPDSGVVPPGQPGVATTPSPTPEPTQAPAASSPSSAAPGTPVVS